MPSIQFKGKTYVHNHHLSVKFHQLVPDAKKSLTKKVSLHDNLIIEGDNLLALKALLPIYAGKVKCIYIDPPYNTGNEGWTYNDNVNSPMMQAWLGKVVDKDDLTRHDKWLCMITPRLKILKELLSEDGVIMVSIDDNEQHRLRQLMDEIFLDENFVANVVWQKSKRGDAKMIANIHEYIMVYAKNKAENLRNGVWRVDKEGVHEVFIKYEQLKAECKSEHEKIREKMLEWYNSLDKEDEKRKHKHYSHSDDRGLYFAADFAGPDDGRKSRPRYDILHPVTKKSCRKPSTGWRWDEDRTKRAMAENPPLIHFGEDETTVPCRKTYLKNVTREPFASVFYQDGRAASAQLNELMGKGKFDYPKNADVIKALVKLVTDDEDIILDSFAGSGTTGHAVLELNQEQNTERKFILVEMEDYVDTLTAERVRRVIKGVPKSKNFTDGAGGSFSYFRLGEPVEMEAILHGRTLPTYEELARYIFYTATGEEFDPKQMKRDEARPFIGESKDYEVFLFYKADIKYLMGTALTLDMARGLGSFNKKKRLVFAPMKYLDQDYLDQLRVEYSQLPFEIYRFQE